MGLVYRWFPCPRSSRMCLRYLSPFALYLRIALKLLSLEILSIKQTKIIHSYNNYFILALGFIFKKQTNLIPIYLIFLILNLPSTISFTLFLCPLKALHGHIVTHIQ